MSHTNLEEYYTVMFNMSQHHKWSLTELENLIPYERDLYVDLLMQHIKKENEKNANA